MSRRHAALAALASLAVAPAAAPASAETVYVCPDRPDAGGAGWWSGRRPGGDSGGPARAPATGVEVVAGRRGAEGGAYPPILKPDSPDGSWALAGESGGLLLVCRFGAGAYAATAIADGVAACRPHRRGGRAIGLRCR